MQPRKRTDTEARWDGLIETLPLPTVVVDPDQIIDSYNQAFGDLYGIIDPVGEIRFYELVHRSDEPVDDCPLNQALVFRQQREGVIHDPILNQTLVLHAAPFFHNGQLSGAVLTLYKSPAASRENEGDQLLIDIYSEAINEMKAREVKVKNVRDAFFNMLEDVNESYQELEELFLKLIRVLINVLDAKSPWTKGHSERVSRYAESIAEEMNMGEETIRAIKLAGLLHDIGKIGTYDYLLDKPGKLTKEEFELVMQHPVQGVRILKGIKQLENILPLIHYHHEKLDGKGYPNKLLGPKIPMGARILHVADSFDSMTSDRPYRKAPGVEYALSELDKFKGSQFDPEVVEAFIRALGKNNRQKI